MGCRLINNAWQRKSVTVAVQIGLAVLPLCWVAPAHAAAAPNNNFNNRITLVGTNVTATSTNVGADKQSGEPNHAGNAGGASLWWSWTAPGSGEVQITTDGSDFDTLLA